RARHLSETNAESFDPIRRRGHSGSAADSRSLVFCPPDDATGNARAGVASRLGFQVVRLRVNYNRTSNRRTFIVCKRDLMVHIVQSRLARRVCLYVSHIAHMPLGCVRSCMRFVGWIKMSTSRTRISRAAIAELMDMKSVIARSQPGDFGPDLHPIGYFG